jgi:hypothetical protein
VLEDFAGVRSAQVTQIMRQKGDYLQAAQALSDGKITKGFEQLDRIGAVQELAGVGNWITRRSWRSIWRHATRIAAC